MRNRQPARRPAPLQHRQSTTPQARKVVRYNSKEEMKLLYEEHEHHGLWMRFVEKVMTKLVIAFLIFVLGVLGADDATGVGVADDVAIPPDIGIVAAALVTKAVKKHKMRKYAVTTYTVRS